MKFIWVISLIFLSSFSHSQTFPITEDVQITMLEVWPSNNSTGRYGARVSSPLTGAGCTYSGGFQIKDGPGAEAAYSTLLAAVAAKMHIQIYITECGYMPVVDRVRLIP